MFPSSDSKETVDCGLTAFAGVEVEPTQIPALRRRPHEQIKVPAGLLKYADDQAAVAVVSVLKAIHDFRLHDTKFTDWGVVAGPRFLGRETCTAFLDKFARQGALSMSPLLAAYQSLHAVAGSISLALNLHGPNLGVGGGHGALVETLLAGLAMRDEHRLPGVWMVFSEWDPEPIVDDNGKVSAGSICRAVAMAFKPVAAGWQGLRLRLVADAAGAKGQQSPATTLAGLADFLGEIVADQTSEQRCWPCPLGWNARLELTGQSHSLAADPRIPTPQAA